MRWYGHPEPPGTAIDVNGRRVYYTILGEGAPTVVIEAGLGTASPEWWRFQEELSKTTRVITYDRAGYGWSEPVLDPRTSEAIASELKEFLDCLKIESPLVLVGHSQGGLYVNHFCRLYPELVAGVVLIDPVSPNDIRFRQDLPPGVYRRSGIDKTRSIRVQSWSNGFGFTRLMKRFILKTKPFLPYRDLPRSTMRVLWNHMLLPQTPRTALNEYPRVVRSRELRRFEQSQYVSCSSLENHRALSRKNETNIHGVPGSSMLKRQQPSMICGSNSSAHTVISRRLRR